MYVRCSVVKSGYLKHLTSLGQWKKRYFKIIGGLFLIFEKSSHVNSIGSFPVHHCIIEERTRQRPNCFRINVANAQVHLFEAYSEEEMKSWVDTLVEQGATREVSEVQNERNSLIDEENPSTSEESNPNLPEGQSKKRFSGFFSLFKRNSSNTTPIRATHSAEIVSNTQPLASPEPTRDLLFSPPTRTRMIKRGSEIMCEVCGYKTPLAQRFCGCCGARSEKVQ